MQQDSQSLNISKMEGQGRREHLEEKKLFTKTMISLLHEDKWPTLFILEPEHRTLFFILAASSHRSSQ